MNIDCYFCANGMTWGEAGKDRPRKVGAWIQNSGNVME